MRFVAFEASGREGLSVQTADGELRGLLSDHVDFPGDLLHLLQTDGLARAYAVLARAPVLEPATIRFLPPIPRPPKIICVGLNYRAHAQESPFEVPAYPVLFARFASSLVGHGGPLTKPWSSDCFDYEGEMAAIIGRGGRRIPRDRALDHVAGYSVFNDATARDYAPKSHQWTVCKNFDASGGFGPAFVTAEELPPGGRDLRITTKVNGRTVQDASTSELIFDLEQLIETISEAITLEPGDVIATGTPEGVGVARTPQLFLKPGDVCEVEVERLGRLVNPVADEARQVQAGSSCGGAPVAVVT